MSVLSCHQVSKFSVHIQILYVHSAAKNKCLVLYYDKFSLYGPRDPMYSECSTCNWKHCPILKFKSRLSYKIRISDQNHTELSHDQYKLSSKTFLYSRLNVSKRIWFPQVNSYQLTGFPVLQFVGMTKYCIHFTKNILLIEILRAWIFLHFFFLVYNLYT